MERKKEIKSVRLYLPSISMLSDRIVGIFRRRLETRFGVQVLTYDEGDLDIELSIKPNIGTEGFQIKDDANGRIQIIGNDERGLLYGVGKFLRTSYYDRKINSLIPGTWQGISVPKKEFRGIYFATHFHNFYHEAPIEEIQTYLEDLSLWGYNTVLVWYDMHHFTGINDPKAKEMITRLRGILKSAKDIKLKVGLLVIGNEAYNNSPIELRADQTFPGTRHIRGGYGVELCPSKPEAKKLMLKWFEEEFESFSDIGIDYVVVWPYDQGGCCCSKCSPWGSNGFLMMAREISDLAHKYFPNSKVILSTWLFDIEEWKGLTKAFVSKPEWVDYILADSHTDFPLYPLKCGVPGNLPLLNFPEISMWGMSPWGGFGANPMPSRLQKLWEQVSTEISGGYPYSEGIFEDINKAIISQFYWGNKKAIETVVEYISSEYSPEVTVEVSKAIEIIEKNHKFFPADGAYGTIEDAGADEAYECLKRAESKLPPSIRDSWRWRILFLRAMIDRERFKNKGLLTDNCEQAFRELTRIYHAENAEPLVAPPKRR